MARGAYVVTAAFLVLSSCGAPLTPPPNVDLRLEPFADGLRVVGTQAPTGSEISFGRDWSGVEASVSSILGPPATRRPCAARTLVRWPGGLELLHDGTTFLGLGCPFEAPA